MAKPKIFVSSTYYDLKYIRKDLEAFIKGMGYEPILFESGDIPFHQELPLDESCYKEIENSNMQVLIIGGRYGSEASYPGEGDDEKSTDSDRCNFYNSITRQEYVKAKEKGMPIFIFVDRGVYDEYDTYKRNKRNKSIKYAHVDSINIFKLLDHIISQRGGNYVKDFENFEDIAYWLKDQWAGLFADYLSKKRAEIEMKTLSSQIRELEYITNTLKEYMEAIMKQVIPNDYQNIINMQEKEIERLKVETFYSGKMMEELSSNFIFPEEDKMEIFEAFKASKTLSDFLERTGKKSEDIKDYLEFIGKRIEYDYLTCKQIYSDSISYDGINDNARK